MRVDNGNYVSVEITGNDFEEMDAVRNKKYARPRTFPSNFGKTRTY